MSEPGGRSASTLDPVAFAERLIALPSVTPRQAGALDLIEVELRRLGFQIRRETLEDVDNLFAWLGEARPRFMFGGHVDVVPPGELGAWSSPPFEPTRRDGLLYGRGAADMKGAIAAFLAACDTVLTEQGPPQGASIAVLLTSDEEGAALHGVRRFWPMLHEEGFRFDHALMGEPTSVDALGDMIKNGRRGSLNVTVRAIGVQGHVAYPHRAANPAPVLVRFLHALTEHRLDEGGDGFQPSNLEIVTIDIGNPASNVIPGEARAAFNIRFNIQHVSAELEAWLRELAAAHETGGVRLALEFHHSGPAFVTPPGRFTALLQDAVETQTGRRPELSTSGGTSDARFLFPYGEVAEFGLVGASMHKIDEHAPVADIELLHDIYAALLRRYLENAPTWP